MIWLSSPKTVVLLIGVVAVAVALAVGTEDQQFLVGAGVAVAYLVVGFFFVDHRSAFDFSPATKPTGAWPERAAADKFVRLAVVASIAAGLVALAGNPTLAGAVVVWALAIMGQWRRLVYTGGKDGAPVGLEGYREQYASVEHRERTDARDRLTQQRLDDFWAKKNRRLP